MAKKLKTVKKESAGGEIKRKFRQNPGLYIGSVVILVLVLAAFLGGDLIAPAAKTWDATFGYYDKAPIRWAPGNVFDQYRSNVIQYYQSQGIDLSSEWTMLQIWQQAFEAAVVHNALLQIMKRSNYVVPEKTVDRKVAQMPDFQENGRFSAVLYNRMPSTEKMNIWRNTHDDIVKGVYFSDFFDGLLLPNAEAEFVGNLASPQRSFNMVTFNIEHYPESEYLSYAEANSRLFDSLHLSKITVNSSERDANRILDTIKSGAITFEEAARTQSQDNFADRGGDMGSRYIFDLEREITSAEDQASVFNLRRGEISPVIQIEGAASLASWVIYRAEDELKKANFSDDIVMERVRSYLRSSARGRMEDWAIREAEEFRASANETDLETAALIREMEVQSFGPVPVNYSGVELFNGIQNYPISGFSDQDIGDLSRNENFWKIAFTAPLNTLSEPLVQGSYVLMLYPTEEINTEETSAQDAASQYLSYWLYSITEQSLQHYFKNDHRMDDRFMETYVREMMQ